MTRFCNATNMKLIFTLRLDRIIKTKKSNRNFLLFILIVFSQLLLIEYLSWSLSDKQQELDLPSLQVEETSERGAKKKEKPRHGGPATTMSQVSYIFYFNYQYEVLNFYVGAINTDSLFLHRYRVLRGL